MGNSNGSGNSSLYKVSLLLCLCLIIRKPVITIAGFIYCLLWSKKTALLFGTLLATALLIETCRCDLIRIGICQRRTESYAIVSKFFYKIKVYGSGFREGDIVVFEVPYGKTDEASLIRNNILYEGNGDYFVKDSFLTRKLVRDRIESLSDECRAAVKRTIYREYDDQSDLDLGYGLFSYYLLRKLRKKSSRVCLLAVVLYSLFFVFETKFFLLLIDCFADEMKIGREDRIAIKIIFVCFLNHGLFSSESILLPLAIDSFLLFDLNMSFNTFLVMMSSFCFHETEMFSIMFFDLSMKARIFLLLFSIFLLPFPFLQGIYLKFIEIYSFFIRHDPVIRAPLSLMALFLFFILRNGFHLEKKKAETFLLLGLLMLPIHDLFFHVTFIDVGQGDAIMLKYPFSYSCVLIDTGPEYSYSKLKKELSGHGVYRIGTLIVTHDDSDHNGNVQKLKQDYLIGEVIEQGKNIDFGKLKLIYYDCGEYDNDNDESLVYSLNVNGKDFLFTGDISQQVEKALIRRYGPLHVDVLKVSHHGSNSASSRFFISSLLPDAAVISTSGKYGHPHREVIETLEAQECTIFSTRESGSISFRMGTLFSFVTTGKNEFVIMR